MTVTAQASQDTQLTTSCPALKQQLQKTKLCLFHLRSACRDGSNCRFAHGQEELNQLPDLSKTSMCPNMVNGKCSDVNCKYAHSSDEIRATNFCYKTTQCMWYAMGKCRNGTQCRFAHGEADRNTDTSYATPQVVDQVSEEKADKKKNKKVKAPQHRRFKETLEIPEPSYVHTESIRSINEQLQASQAYLNLLGMQQFMGYPMTDAVACPPGLGGVPYMGPVMPGVGYESYEPYYNSSTVPESVAQESVVPGPDTASVKELSKHIKDLTEQVKMLQDKVNTTVRSDSRRSIYSGATSAVSGSMSNDDLVSSEASETTSQDGWGNVGAVDNQLA